VKFSSVFVLVGRKAWEIGRDLREEKKWKRFERENGGLGF
jgi:hypothetical protein